MLAKTPGSRFDLAQYAGRPDTVFGQGRCLFGFQSCREPRWSDVGLAANLKLPFPQAENSIRDFRSLKR